MSPVRKWNDASHQWHANGSLTKKQNVFDDFYACAKLLVDKTFLFNELGMKYQPVDGKVAAPAPK